MDDDELKKLFERIKEKMDNNPHLNKEVESLVLRLEEIFETKVSLNLFLDDDLDEYKEHLMGYSESELELFNSDKISSMNVENLIGFLNDEEKDLRVFIDPIYLKKGLNNVVDMYVTTLNDKIILVPVTNKEDEKI